MTYFGLSGPEEGHARRPARGILRRAIAELLSAHPEVLEFKLAEPKRGGGGATEVQLRKS